MQSLKARVRNGRLMLDEPTELPEGEVVNLAPVPTSMGGLERAASEQPRDPTVDAEMSQFIDEKELLAELRSLV